MESICAAAGMRTALYTSPHLISLQERLRVRGKCLPIESWRRASDVVARAVESDEKLEASRPTFFESLTVICVLLISESDVDIAIIEAGMGGRFDATSVCGASAAVITPIGMDHTEYLGDTLEAIASEKFAAVRPGAPAFYAADDERLTELFSFTCEKVGAPCFALASVAFPRNVHCSLDGTTFDYVCGAGRLGIRGLRTPLAGVHQARNASDAISVLLLLKEFGGQAAQEKNFPGLERIGEREIRAGLISVDWPGRMELIRRGEGLSPLILDGAHNEHGFRALVDSLRSLVEDGAVKSIGAIVFAVMRDKDISRIVECLKSIGAPIFCAQPPTERASPAGALASLLRDAGCDVAGAYVDPMEALDAATASSGSDELVVCCGSLFLVGAIKQGMLRDNTRLAEK
jgi:dihydrofolate synthase/folylpolyglutamate synthase